MTGELAGRPACPPFPDFTDFESNALNCIAVDLGPDEAAFRAQVSACQVVDRFDTVVGFYTRVRVDKSKCRPLSSSFKGAQFKVGGVEPCVGVVLWEGGSDGHLETIEGWTVGDDGLGGQQLNELRFIGRYFG
jgi:hypothetical protein